MSLYQPKNTPFWHYDFQWKGARFYGSTGETSRRRAQAVEDAVKLKVKTGTGRARATLDEAAEHYWQHTGQYARAAKADEKRLLWLVTALGPHRMMHEIEEPDLIEALARRRGLGSLRGETRSPISNATLNRCVTELYRRIHGHARRRMKVEVAEIDWREIRLPEAEHRVRELTYDEQARLLAHLREDLHAIVLFSLATGLRHADALNLTRFQCDLQAGVVRVRVKSKRPGRKQHRMELTPSTVALLAGELALHDHPQVFTYQPHDTHGRPREGAPRKPLTVSVLRRQWEKALDDAGIKDARWHDLRHTFGSRFNRVAGLAATKRALGHESMTTTAKYAHASDEDMRKGLARMEEEAGTADQSRNSPEERATKRRKGRKNIA